MGRRSKPLIVAIVATLLVAGSAPATAIAVEPDPVTAAPPKAGVDAAPGLAVEPATVTVAHRAGAGKAPEQTHAAMTRAVDIRPEHIEIDVQLSKDDVPVIVHDRTFARTTDVESVFPGRENDPIGSFTYREIRRLDAGSWFGKKFAGQRIPRLSAVVDHLDGTGVGLFLELKNPKDSPGLERAVDKVIDADYRWRGVPMTFLSFDADSLHRMAKLRSTDRLLWLSPDVPSTSTLRQVAGWADELGTDYRRLTRQDVRRVHAAGLRLAVYTVNTRSAQSWVLSIRADSLITDYPEWVKS